MLVAVWLLVALPTAAALFLNGSRTIVLAGHDAVVSPSLDGWATLDLGPYLPNLRYPSGSRLGAHIDLGKTTAGSYQVLIQRYAFIASQPQAQIRKVRGALTDLAVDSAVDGALIGLAGPGLVLVVGRRRWAELRKRVGGLSLRGAAVGAAGVLVVGVVAVRPWDRGDEPVEKDTWQPLASTLPEVKVPAEAKPLQIESGLMTNGTRRLVASAVGSYRKSVTFYHQLTDLAPEIAGRLHTPAEGERVGLLVSDRHDNVGMDPVAHAIAKEGHASFLLDAGDDTSTGSAWEAFSMESLAQSFDDLDPRFSVAGNHDHGSFVTKQADHLGFTTLTGKVVDGPDGMRILGVSDPRSSGLGIWRDARGISFAEQESRLADLACEHDADDDRIDVLLVHDANSGREALSRGCVGAVLAGHLHVQVGPTAVPGSNGKVGWTYTNGTTGGAAYALAIGSKLRREAEVTLVTFRNGRLVGLQPVSITTIGTFRVAPYISLDQTGRNGSDSGGGGGI
jgi:hypothetical protein